MSYKEIMKKYILALFIMMVGVFGVSAQEQSNNEGFVGYSFVRQDVKVERPTLTFNKDTDSQGFNVAYTRYVGENEVKNKANVIGLTGNVSANFRGSDEVLVIATGGVVVKARNNKYVQPFLTAQAGAAKQNVKVSNLTELSDWSSAYVVGTGIDFNTKANSRYKIRVGVDYVNTGFFGERQHTARFTTGLVF